MARRIFCAFLAGGAVCILLAIFLILGPGSAEAQKAVGMLASEGVTTIVTVDEPDLTPAYAGLCDSAWYSYTNASTLGHPAFLTLNAENSKSSLNSGEWRPDLPKDGFYLVEAYIPTYTPFVWDCPRFTQPVNTNTSSAFYAVHSGTTVLTVTVDQSTVNNSWKPLGSFYFRAGRNGSVTLRDITGEPNYEHSVSFSAMRFTYIKNGFSYYFPFLSNDTSKAVALKDVSALDGSGRLRNAFVPIETVHWTASGYNNLGYSSLITFTRTIESPCAPAVTATGTFQAPPGNWSHVFTSTVTNCTGLYNYSYQVNHKGYITSDKATYSVNLPGFDICSIPTIEQMSTWWNLSPYYSMNLYMGGISLSGCARVHPDAAWVRLASQQGWTFVPTWVGLQAPCASYVHPMDWDPVKARQQGIDEANQAVAASRNLGLNGNHTIYFDLEYFSSTNQACYSTVKSFLQGWVDQMHALNMTPGLYGVASDFNRWASMTPPPDRVWLAAWNSTYFYDPNVSPWMPNYLSNNLWFNHQRLRQYTGDHYETWGGVKLGIDSDVVDTKLISSTPTSLSVITMDGEVTDPVAQPGQDIQSLQEVTPGQGWVLKSGRLYWTPDEGKTWQALNSPDQGVILTADFIDSMQGWVASRNPVSGEVQLSVTMDRGMTWKGSKPAQNPDDPPVGMVSLSFLDEQTGWAAYTFQTGSAFSRGVLFYTEDGGANWIRLKIPAAGKIRFISRFEGWLQGGPGGGDVYHTTDAGLTWQRVVDGDPRWNTAQFAFMNQSPGGAQGNNWSTERLIATLPEGFQLVSYVDASSGWALIQEGVCQGEKLKPGEQAPDGARPFSCDSTDRVLKTSNGGQTWSELLNMP